MSMKNDLFGYEAAELGLNPTLNPILNRDHQEILLEAAHGLAILSKKVDPSSLLDIEEGLYQDTDWIQNAKKKIASQRLGVDAEVLDSLVDIEEPKKTESVSSLIREYEAVKTMKKEIVAYFKKFKSVGHYGNLMKKYDSLDVSKKLPNNLNYLTRVMSKLDSLKGTNTRDHMIEFKSTSGLNDPSIDSIIGLSSARKYSELYGSDKVNVYWPNHGRQRK